MDEDLESLIRLQNQVKQCRRMADEISDPETSQLLRALADEVERRARKIDAMD
jgi:DNA-binding ferritin-like protein